MRYQFVRKKQTIHPAIPYRDTLVDVSVTKCVLRLDENGYAGRIWPAGRSLENPDIDYEEGW